MNDRKLQHQISLILRFGINLSGTLILIGFILVFINGVPDADHSYNSSWNIFERLFEMDVVSPIANPYFYLYSGIIALMLTPIVRVLLTLIGFALEKDIKYVVISSIVLIVIGCSIGFSIIH